MTMQSPSAQEEEIGLILVEPSSFLVVSNTTGVP